MIDMHAITILTIGAVIANGYVAVRCFRYALKLETTKVWLCKTVDVHLAIKVLLLQGCCCFILVVLKFWAIFDVFIKYWHEMPETYHIRAYAFLAENYTLALLGLAVVKFVKCMGDYHDKAIGEMHECGVDEDRRKSIDA
jgi:hypothetical protein